MDLVKNVYLCDQGMSEGQRDFVESFDKVQIINPVNKINEKTEIVWDKTWLKKVGSKTENLLKLVEDNNRYHMRKNEIRTQFAPELVAEQYEKLFNDLLLAKRKHIYNI